MEQVKFSKEEVEGYFNFVNASNRVGEQAAKVLRENGFKGYVTGEPVVTQIGDRKDGRFDVSVKLVISQEFDFGKNPFCW